MSGGSHMAPSGWFDESPDDSRGIFAYIQGIQIFIAGRQTGSQEVVQEVLADLKNVKEANGSDLNRG